ncbi:hypothetical protein BC826DRAFT_1185383 [Russula brevipes]|nr:hypothetical protein BC826DRAFT_1185383 [Russula brevipes]
MNLDKLDLKSLKSPTRALPPRLDPIVVAADPGAMLVTLIANVSFPAVTEITEGAEREAAAAGAKLTIANRAQAQAEAAQKQAMRAAVRDARHGAQEA